ncbi:hypothetical protein ACIPSA_39780 [Streptomyces sp. NPDC086549]|uniref:hypothetical protein n=1 Tax=Streptomyces sp. NPDC086549 TaxID=3365752 RepID=UPI003830E395
MPRTSASEVAAKSRRGFGRGRRGLLLLAAIGSLVGTTACDDGGDGGWKTPGKGQAAVLLDGKNSGALDLQGGGELEGLTITADGTVYVLRSGIQRIKSDRTVESLRPELTKGSSGLVALPDGSLVFGKDHAIQKYGRDQHVTVLAGVPGKGRAATAPVPKSTAAAGFRFADNSVSPIGVRPDGALILLDGDVVWSLAHDRLTRVYEIPAADRKNREMDGYAKAAVDGKGTVYVTSGPKAGTDIYSHVTDVVAIHTDGTVAPIALPKSVRGVTGNLAEMKLVSITSDGADGIYADTYNDEGMYILHIHAGLVDLVMHHAVVGEKSSYSPYECPLKHPVDAKKLPCALPSAMAYGDGKLVLGGNTHYLLQIGTK